MPAGFKLLDAYVEVTASGKGLAEKVGRDFEAEAPQATRRASSSFGSNLLGGMKGLGGIGSSAAGFFGSAFTGVIGGLVGGITSTVTTAIGNTVGAIGSMLTSVGSLVASTVIDFNSTLQNATIGFTTMLGSGEKSAAFLNQLQNFAKTTPFEFKNLISNAQNMMGMGIAAKDVIPDLTALGDSVASIGGSAAQVDQVTLAFDQMAAKGTLDMGNMNQLMQGGVPSALKIMAAAYHVTTGQMIANISAGKVQADVALPALIKGIEKGTKSTAALGGMMAKQSTTFTGALSNIQDGLTQTVSKAFKPFFDTASKGMQRFATALSGKPAQKFQADVTRSLKPFAGAINGWFKTVDIGSIFTKAGKAITGMLKGIKPKEVIGGLQDAFEGVKDIVKEIIPIVPKVAKALKDIGPGVRDTVKQVVDFVGALSDMMSFFQRVDKNVTTWHKDWTAQMGRNWKQMTGDISGFVTWTLKFFADWVGQIGRDVAAVVTFFTDLPTQIGGVGAQIVEGLISGLQNTWGRVTSVVKTLVDSIPLAIRKLLGIASPSKVMKVIGTQVGEGLHVGLLGTVDQIKSASDKLGKAMTAPIEKRLIGLSKRRQKVLDTLADQKDQLSSLRADKASYAAGVVSSVHSSGDIASLYGAPTMTQAAAGSLNGSAYQASYASSTGGGLAGVKAKLKKLLADTKAFTSGIKTLIRRGLDKYTFQQLIDAGPAAGLPIVTALLSDKSAMADISSYSRQLEGAGSALGSFASKWTYDRPIGIEKSKIAASESKANRITVNMIVEARKIDEVDKLVKMVKALKQTSRTKAKKK